MVCYRPTLCIVFFSLFLSSWRINVFTLIFLVIARYLHRVNWIYLTRLWSIMLTPATILAHGDGQSECEGSPCSGAANWEADVDSYSRIIRRNQARWSDCLPRRGPNEYAILHRGVGLSTYFCHNVFFVYADVMRQWDENRRIRLWLQL